MPQQGPRRQLISPTRSRTVAGVALCHLVFQSRSSLCVLYRRQRCPRSCIGQSLATASLAVPPKGATCFDTPSSRRRFAAVTTIRRLRYVAGSKSSRRNSSWRWRLAFSVNRMGLDELANSIEKLWPATDTGITAMGGTCNDDQHD